MAINTAESFLALLKSSNLLTAEQLAEAQQAVEDNGEPQSLARALVRKGLLTRWQAAQLLAGRRSLFLGKYKLVDLLGRGGMGKVFLGHHTMMNRRVALKIVSKELGQDPAALRRFLDEARAIAQLDHPNIVQAYDVDSEGDRYYIAMEYVDGDDLQRLVEKQGPLDCSEAADYIRQAAEGLSHAHSRNIIHCDIKPSNLLINREGTVKILDMGLARLTGHEARHADSDNDKPAVGTVDYQSPEQGLETPDFNHRADIYSLGCTLYFLLTGHPPFPEGTIAQRIMKHQTQEPRSISEQRPETPEELVQICRRMMAKNPDDRFQTADEVGRALAAWRPSGRGLKTAQPLEDGPEVGFPQIDLNLGASTASPEKAPATDAEPPDRKPWWRVHREKIYLGIAGAAVLVFLIALIVHLAGSGGASEKKAGDGGDEQKTHTAATKPGPKKTDDEDDWQIKPKPEVKPTEKPEPKPEKPEPKEPGPKEPKPEEPKPEQPKTEEPKPKPEQPKVEEPKPEEPTPKPEQPQPKPKPGNPLRELASAVDLPLPGEQTGVKLQQWLPLGKVYLDPDGLDLSLVGGAAAVKGKRELVLEPEQRTDEARTWLAKLTLPTGAGDAEEIARLRFADRQLQLQWLTDIRDADALAACALVVRAGGEEPRLLQLSPPVVGESLVLDLDRGSAREQFTLKSLPDADNLRWEIVNWEGQFPADRAIDPAEPVAPRKPVAVVFQRKDPFNNVQPLVTFRATLSVSRTNVTVDFRLLQPTAAMLRQAVVGQAAAQNARKQIEQRLKDARGEERIQLSAQLNRVDALLDAADFYQNLNGKGRIHVRVFWEATDAQSGKTYQLDLVQTKTGVAAEPKPE